MKNLGVILGLVALLATALLFFYTSNTSQLVYVDVNKLIDGYKRTKVEREKFNQKSEVLKAGVDSLLKDWQNELKAYEKERASLTKKELALKQQLLQNKQQQIGNYQQAIQKQIQEADQKATQTVINDINDYVKEYGKANNHDIIFGANGNGNIMYGKESSDLTATILEGINKDYEGDK